MVDTLFELAMDNTQDLLNAMNKLFVLNRQLVNLCGQQRPAFVGFDIEKITVENEQSILSDGINSLAVKKLMSANDRAQLFNSWGHYFKVTGLSTKFVDRTPGIVVITEDVSQIKSLITNINTCKDNVASIVRANRDQYERHQFIHENFPTIMTEQVYRHIHYFEHEVTNAWFNWASRPVPKMYSTEAALELLDQQFKRPKYNLSANEWQALITNTMNEVKSGKFDYIQQIKEYRVLPTIELQYIDNEHAKKRSKSNATTPFFLFGQPNNYLPKYSTLSPYINKRKNKKTKLSANKTMINPYLKLVGVKKILS